MRARRGRRNAPLLRIAAIAVVGLGVAVARADDAARIAAIRERAILAADVLRASRLAEACGRRDAAWSARVLRMVIARQQEDADRFAGEIQGGRDAILWMMLGARMTANAAADAEHDRYGEVACRDLDASSDVDEVDRLLAAEPG